jgi:electron transport complex protein RnfE
LLIACKNRVDEVLAEGAKARQVEVPVQSRRVRVTGVIE